MQAAAQPAISELAAATADLVALLSDENEALAARNVKKVELNLVKKAELANRLDAGLRSLKETGVDSETPGVINIQNELAIVQSLGRKNATLMQVAHQTRVDTLNLIRDMVNEEQPKTNYYSANGDIKETKADTSLINKSA